jgi:hypothetical protein
MIEIKTERLVNLNEAAKLLPSARAGTPTHPATIWRLIAAGELEGLHLGHRWVTSVEAIQRFAERRTEAALARLGRHPEGKKLDGKRRRKRRESREVELARVASSCDEIGI